VHKVNKHAGLNLHYNQVLNVPFIKIYLYIHL